MVKVTLSDGNRLVEEKGRCAIVFLIDPPGEADAQTLMLGTGNAINILLTVTKCLGSLVNTRIENPGLRELVALIMDKEFMSAVSEDNVEIKANETSPVVEE